jgi:hypothetical protein
MEHPSLDEHFNPKWNMPSLYGCWLQQTHLKPPTGHITALLAIPPVLLLIQPTINGSSWFIFKFLLKGNHIGKLDWATDKRNVWSPIQLGKIM